MSFVTWRGLHAARSHDASARVPFCIGAGGDAVRVGSVARAHLEVLARCIESDAADAWHVGDDAVVLRAERNARDGLLTRLNLRLRDAGLVRAWRDETYAIVTGCEAQPLALIERATARFWGTLTFAAQCNGYRLGADGSPSHLWIARRSMSKAIDPGLLDNMIGGGVAHEQSPFQALQREGYEEAGLPATLIAQATRGSVIEMRRDVREGLQHEQLYVYDLALPGEVVPHNHDGEVAEFRCVPVAVALALACGPEMALDAALVTLDFALRHRLLGASQQATLAQRFASVLVVPPELPGH